MWRRGGAGVVGVSNRTYYGVQYASPFASARYYTNFAELPPATRAVLNGRPATLEKRKVVIRIPGKSSMQAGVENAKHWGVFFDQPRDSRWHNNLMGWTSTTDSLAQVSSTLKFDSKEAAIAWVETQGFDYRVEEGEGFNHVPPRKVYADNIRQKKLRVNPYHEVM